jgi:hypothetical protein
MLDPTDGRSPVLVLPGELGMNSAARDNLQGRTWTTAASGTPSTSIGTRWHLRMKAALIALWALVVIPASRTITARGGGP